MGQEECIDNNEGHVKLLAVSFQEIHEAGFVKVGNGWFPSVNVLDSFLLQFIQGLNHRMETGSLCSGFVAWGKAFQNVVNLSILHPNIMGMSFLGCNPSKAFDKLNGRLEPTLMGLDIGGDVYSIPVVFGTSRRGGKVNRQRSKFLCRSSP